MNKKLQRQRNGFTLVEVAIVIVFMGIFITFASSMLKGIALSSKYRAARDKLTTTSDAVQAWAVKNRRIPSSFTSFTSATGNPRDYWNKTYTYRPYDPITGAISDICRQSSTNLSVCLGDTCTSSNMIRDIAYVIISGGDNLIVNPAWLVTTSPCSAAQPCVPIKDLSTTNDDFFKYVTLLELKKTVGCVEADSRLRILNVELPPARINNKYVVPVMADGGQNNLIDPKYSWCVQGIPPTGLSLVPAIASCPSSFTNATFVNISGVPNLAVSGTSTPLTFQVKDSIGVINTKAFVLNVN